MAYGLRYSACNFGLKRRGPQIPSLTGIAVDGKARNGVGGVRRAISGLAAPHLASRGAWRCQTRPGRPELSGRASKARHCPDWTIASPGPL